MRKLTVILAVAFGLMSCENDNDYQEYNVGAEPQQATKVLYEKTSDGVYKELTRQDVVAKHQVLNFRKQDNVFYNVYYKPTNTEKVCIISYYFVDSSGIEQLMFTEPSKQNKEFENFFSDEYFYINECK